MIFKLWFFHWALYQWKV